MKRRISTAIIMVMMITMCAFAGAFAEESTYSVDFEDMSSSMFTMSGSVRLSVSGDQAHEGKYSLKVSDRKQNDWDAADLRIGNTPIATGEEFSLSVWVYVESDEAGDFTIGKAGGDYAYLKTARINGREWTCISFKATVDELQNLRFMTTSSNWIGCAYYVDDLTITAKTAEAVVPDNDMLMSYTSDFSSGTDGWYARGTGETRVSVTADGLYTEGRTATWNSPGRDFPLTSGVSYDLSVWIYQDEKDVVPFILSLARTKDGTESYANLGTADVKKGVWTELKCTYKAGAYDAYVLYVETGSGLVSFTMKDFKLSADFVSYRFDIPVLKDVYAGSFEFGGALTREEAENNALMDFYQSQFSILTPGNELKPDSLIDVVYSKQLAKKDDTQVALRFSAAKPMLDQAKARGIKVHGHVLVWHSQTPEAFFHEGYDVNKPFVSREVMLARLDNYIRQVMEYTEKNYPGLIVSWDVVNEAVADGSTKLRDSNWTRVVGEDFINRAFEIARKYAPEGTLLFYNDYNSASEPKLTGIAKVMAGLIADGTVDGFGFQSHYDVNSPGIKTIRNAFDRILGLGNVKLRISELDVSVRYDLDTEYQKQADYYGQLMDLYREYSDDIVSVQVWGVTDDQSWRASGHPLLFDKNGQPKPAFWAVAEPDKAAE